MSDVIIVFKTDAWHTRSSKEFMGVFSSNKEAVKAIKKNNKLSCDDLNNLESIQQTQGRVVNFILECVAING